MRILVTGSSGFTGQHFVTEAKALGHKVFGLDCDIRNFDDVSDRLSSVCPECIVHLGAKSFVGLATEFEYYDVNVTGTANLLAACRISKAKIRKVLISSSANVYGNSQNSPVKETEQFDPQNHYALSKQMMEQLIAFYMDEIPIVVTRPFNYTGRLQSPNFIIPKLVNSFKAKAEFIKLGNIDVEREFNDVRAVCKTYLGLLEKRKSSEVYNICSGVSHSLKDIISLLEDITSHNMIVKFDEKLARKNELTKLVGDNSKIKALFGDVPLSNIENTLRWMLI